MQNSIITALSKFKSIIDLCVYFSNDANAYSFLEKLRWGTTVVCPYCGSIHTFKIGEGHRHKCNDCKKSFTALVGMVFQSTKLPLVKWFGAMFLANHSKGISSVQLAKDLQITQKTAWFILQKVRNMMVQDDTLRLCNTQCDELYYGGREKNKHKSKKTSRTQGRSTKTKTPIFGMVDSEGLAVVKVVPNAKAKTLMPIIKKYVLPNCRVWTDELNAYKQLPKAGFKHEFVKHKDDKFVKWNGVTTNKIEGLWGEFQRMVIGTYHRLSKKH
ncbi:MAG: IS1595 family transposase, partial [Paludibacteraceae bacterium]|nr:IS1595 family transposase [Paludibacteraceae bacterium]